MDNTSSTIEEILVADKIITPEQMALARAEHVNTGKSTEDVLITRGMVSEEDLAKVRAKIFGIPYISLKDRIFSPEVLGFINENTAKKYGLIALTYDKNTNILTVAMIDPMDMQVLGFLEKSTGKIIKPFMASPKEIFDAVNYQYSQSLSSEVTAALKEAPKLVVEEAIDENQMAEIIRKEPPVAKIVSALLSFATKARASDIHIEPQEDKSRVRFRIDGILTEKLMFPKGIHDAVLSRIKILSDLKIDEKRIPQDGRFNFKGGDVEVDIRVSTLPTVNGEKVVMRLLRKSGGVPTMADLGLRGTALKNLEIEILKPHGIVIVCGPTGSGKTTTLYAVLSKINSSKINISTLEDPVEYQMPGINQVQVNIAAGLTFASGLRAFLRQDPNVILVGEIRDAETTRLAIQASLTGHLVFSTLHTNSAAGALPRLLDMGAESFLLASSMNACVGQRICRKICTACKEEIEPPKEAVEDIKQVLDKLLPEDKKNGFKLYHGKGCSVCGNTGYSGRIGIFEVLPVTNKIGKLILERATAGALETEAREEGMITMKQDGYLKVLEGVTTLEEVVRVAQD